MTENAAAERGRQGEEWRPLILAAVGGNEQRRAVLPVLELLYSSRVSDGRRKAWGQVRRGLGGPVLASLSGEQVEEQNRRQGSGAEALRSCPF